MRALTLSRSSAPHWAYPAFMCIQLGTMISIPFLKSIDAAVLVGGGLVAVMLITHALHTHHKPEACPPCRVLRVARYEARMRRLGVDEYVRFLSRQHARTGWGAALAVVPMLPGVLFLCWFTPPWTGAGAVCIVATLTVIVWHGVTVVDHNNEPHQCPRCPAKEENSA